MNDFKRGLTLMIIIFLVMAGGGLFILWSAGLSQNSEDHAHLLIWLGIICCGIGLGIKRLYDDAQEKKKKVEGENE